MINPIINVIQLFNQVLSALPFAVTAFLSLSLALFAILAFINLFLR